MSNNGDEELLDYINALLTEGHESARLDPQRVAPSDEAISETAVSNVPQVSVPQPKSVPNDQQQAEALRLLELEKRKKLQQLLSSHAIHVAEEKPKPSLPLIESPEPPRTQKTKVLSKTSEKISSAEVQPESSVFGAMAPEASLSGRPAIDKQNAEPLRKKLAYLEWNKNGRPQWAQQAFDVLLFKVSGLSLAVPLVSLGHIHTLDEHLTPIFGQVNWFIGLQPSPSGQVKVVNTALFVMPERYNKEFLETMKYVVTIDGLDWGLAVDDVQQPVKLQPSDVTWRTARTKRPWLAGTVKSAMCALIDIPNMGTYLEMSQSNSSP